MKSQTLAIIVALLVVCCCCFGKREITIGPSQESREDLAKVAYAPATEAARAAANSYVEQLAAALRRELPSLVLLDTAAKDWCAPRGCDLAADYFFGTDGDRQTSMARIDAVLRRYSTNIMAGMDSFRSACPELAYEIRRPEGTSDITRARPWTSRALWVDTSDPESSCATRLRPTPDVTAGPVHRVRVHDVDVTALLAGTKGTHRSIVQISVGGPYLGRMP
ncbi:MAG TPA: hypothetical protein VFC19_51445 [Candidatus Limnocylindrales bacterium]|nr:hypothetical protein [Candidatus Limnocylindrales bacterium]